MEALTKGVFQVGVLVSDVDECLKLFCDLLGMKVVFEARNQIQRAKGLSGVEEQVMNVLMLHGEDGAELEIHQYVSPKAKEREPMNHSDLGSMHFMLKVKDMEKVVEGVTALGYEIMISVVRSSVMPDFKYAYFRGPDGMMVGLHEGECKIPEGYDASGGAQ